MSSLYVVNCPVPQDGCPADREAERGRLTATILTYAGNMGVGHVVTPERLAGMSVAELRGMAGMIPEEYAPGLAVNAAGYGSPPALQDVKLPPPAMHFDNPLAPRPAGGPATPPPVANAAGPAVPPAAVSPWAAGPPALQDVKLPLPVLRFDNPLERR